ncbi:MAG: BadF/BadG/BcrA/BcrD ATPase family protein [Opitutaceae bacterium]
MKATYRIGVDGGGTKTECILVDASGQVAARHVAAGCNPSIVGSAGARALIGEALQALVADQASTTIDHLLLCMAGSQPFWRETATLLHGFGQVEAAPDSLPVLELATGGAPGLAVHAGTGSFVAARAPDGSVHYAGGLGWRFGDSGSGYDLGRRAVARALLELQGWAEPTALAEALCQYTGLSDYAANSGLFYADAAANAKIAAFAPRIIELAEQGCETAQQIIAESLSDLAALVSRVLQQLFPRVTAGAPISCGISGALLNRPPCLLALRAFAATQAWPVHLQPITDPPIEGVRRLLLQMK